MDTNAKILIIEESPQVREFYRLLLRKMDYHPITAKGGEEAIKYMHNTDVPFKMIFMDLLMSGQTGWETLTQIRRTPGYDSTPVVVITGIELPEVQMTRLQEYCQKVLRKSEFSLDTVRALLQQFAPQ